MDTQSQPNQVAIPEKLKNLLDTVFVYHAPKPGQAERYEMLRRNAKSLAYDIAISCPDSRERSMAFTKLQECVMFANAAIAINE